MEACGTAALVLVVVFDLLDMVLRAGMGVIISPGTDPCIGLTMVEEATTGVIGAIADAVALFGR